MTSVDEKAYRRKYVGKALEMLSQPGTQGQIEDINGI